MGAGRAAVVGQWAEHWIGVGLISRLGNMVRRRIGAEVIAERDETTGDLGEQGDNVGALDDAAANSEPTRADVNGAPGEDGCVATQRAIEHGHIASGNLYAPGKI